MNTLDQYYISPEAERRHEIERAESIEDTRTAYAEDLTGLLQDLRDSLKRDNAELASVTIDPVTLAVEIKVK